MSSYPLIEAFLRRSQRGVGQINSRGAAIGSALQPFAARAGSYFGAAQSQEASLGSALSSSLTGTGASLGAQIGGSLSANQAPAQAVAQYGGGTATTGAQAGAAVGALSSADLERLKGQASAEQIYAAALPRLAALAADQERRAFLEDAQQELADLAAQEASQRAALARDDRDFRYRQRQDRAAAARDRRDFRYGVKQDKVATRRQRGLDQLAAAAARQEYGLDLLGARQSQERIEISKGNLALATRRQGESERQFATRERRYQQQFQAKMRAARQQGKEPNSALSAKYGYIVDSNGRPILTKKGKRIPVRSDSSSSKPPWEK